MVVGDGNTHQFFLFGLEMHDSVPGLSAYMLKENRDTQ